MSKGCVIIRLNLIPCLIPKLLTSTLGHSRIQNQLTYLYSTVGGTLKPQKKHAYVLIAVYLVTLLKFCS